LPADSQQDAKIAQAIQDVSEKAQLLVREEIELAKAEVEQKVKSLAKGAVIGSIAGFFALVGAFMVLNGFAWLAWYIVPVDDQAIFWGFFIVAAILFLLGALGGFLAARAFKKGSPPVPHMAIEEAQQIRATIESSKPGSSA